MVQGRFRIMVVGSQPAVRMLICSQLRELGHDALTSVPDLATAQARLAVEPVDIVILDMESIVDSLAALRADAALGCLPVVVLSSRSDQETVNACLALGVSGYLIKPASAATVDACLKRALDGAGDGPSARAVGS